MLIFQDVYPETKRILNIIDDGSNSTSVWYLVEPICFFWDGRFAGVFVCFLCWVQYIFNLFQNEPESWLVRLIRFQRQSESTGLLPHLSSDCKSEPWMLFTFWLISPPQWSQVSEIWWIIHPGFLFFPQIHVLFKGNSAKFSELLVCR